MSFGQGSASDVEGPAAQQHNADHFMQLNNWLQAHKNKGPLNCVMSSVGSDHEPTWTAKISIDGTPYGEGEATTKKGAREVAAERALIRLKQT